MAVEVKVPSVGESVQEGIIYKWHKNDGEYVEMDDVIVELETDKATVEIVSEGSGVITTQKKEGDTVSVGEVIATLDETAAKPAETTASAPAPQATAAPATESAPPPPPPAAAASVASPQNQSLSPAVGRMVAEHHLDPNTIAASGRGGRLTKEDVVNHMKASPAAPTGSAAPNLQVVNQPSSNGERGVRREPMSMLRRRIAERMLHAQANAALLTTFNEIDMHEVMQIRKQYKESFKEKHGVGLGFMSFFVKATIAALKECPAINGWIEGNEIVYHDYYDVGVAVSSPRGLVVPVIRDCDKLNFAEIEGTIAEKAQKARAGKLTVDEMQGGTFTITNGGVFGSLMSTPILNPPQSGILGMHTIKQRPMVVNGEIMARPMMYVALSYDHRIVDGSEAVTFLVKIKEAIEDPSRLLLGV